MGPMFYLVQLKEAPCLISAVILADWPHEFALALLLGKRAGGGCTPWPAAFSAGFFWGCAAKKARFLDPVQQPLNAITMAKASAAARALLASQRRRRKEGSGPASTPSAGKTARPSAWIGAPPRRCFACRRSRRPCRSSRAETRQLARGTRQNPAARRA